ncbi:MAG: hypothetical protein L0Y56_10730, partial [Nitrospira sp.]|nr:hypothetical protein [Nitrospira sp.]
MSLGLSVRCPPREPYVVNTLIAIRSIQVLSEVKVFPVIVSYLRFGVSILIVPTINVVLVQI